MGLIKTFRFVNSNRSTDVEKVLKFNYGRNLNGLTVCYRFNGNRLWLA